jgi:hypothetical protein
MALRIILMFLLVCFATVFNGQSPNPFMTDADGKPLYLHAEYKADGSPYLSDKYQLADVVAADGKIYTGIMVKIDLAENRIVYMVKEGIEMVASLPVSKIIFNSYVNDDGTAESNTFIGYPKALNEPGNAVYQVLEAGNTTLLRNIKVIFRDERKYNEAGKTRIFSQTEGLFALLPGNKLVKVEKGADAVAALFPNKNKEVSAFIGSSHLKCKSKDDDILVFKF